MADASLTPIEHVARALGELVDRVVFIGGAVAPLLQVERSFRAPRPTKDVDAIAVTAGYPDFDRLHRRLRTRGFREAADGGHAHRWITPGSLAVPFDLVPVGEHLGSSGNPWDQAAVDTAATYEIAPGLTIRHASGPGFLALKLAAFRDRGAEDPHASADLEDVFALLASRRPSRTRSWRRPRRSARSWRSARRPCCGWATSKTCWPGTWGTSRALTRRG